MTKPNDPAFITQQTWERGETMVINAGLTKREYFAAMAMQGLLGNSEAHKAGFGIDDKRMTVPEASVFIADTLILVLNKKDAYSPQ